MAIVKVTVDGDTVMDGDMGTWTSEPPFITEQRLAVAAKRDQPWAIPVLGLIAKAGMGHGNLTVDVHTKPNGWTLDVTS